MGTTLRHSIENRLSALGRFIFQNRYLVLLLTLVAAVSLISNVRHLTMDTSTEGFLHEDDPTLITYNAFRDQFGRDELVLVTITTPDGVFNQDTLKKLKQLHDELREKTPYLDDITSLINARNTRGAEGELIVEDLLENWPQNEAELAAVRERAMANPTYRNMLLSEDGRITTIVIKNDAYPAQVSDADVMAGFDDMDGGFGIEEPGASAEPPPEAEPLSDAQNAEIVHAIQTITEGYQSEDFQIHLAGSPIVTDVLKTSMQKNMRTFMLLALLAITGVLFLLFKRISGVFLPMLTVILSLGSTLGLMGLLGIPFKLPTQILPSFLLAVSIGATVHLMSVFFRKLQRLHEENETTESFVHKEEALAHAMGHSGLAIIMTSLTTAAGLASFAGAKVAPISDLGIVSAVGVLIALVYTLLLIPSLLAILPLKAKKSHRARKGHARMDAILIAVADFSTQRAYLVLGISAVLLLIGITGAMQSKFSHKPFEWLPEDNYARIATDYVNDEMRGASSVEVIIDTGMTNGLYEPATMAGIARLSDEVNAIDQGELFVGKTLSLADILKEINKALNENRDEAYTTPDDRELIAQEFLLFENSGSDDLEDFVDSQFSKSRFTAKMPWVDAVLYTDFTQDLEQRFRRELGEDVNIEVTGMAALLGRTMGATIFSMAESYIIAAVVITFMMILLIGNIRVGLVSMIPNLTPIILTLGLMGWFGLPIDLFTMLIGSIAIGLAVDDTIHFMHNYRRYHHDTGDVRKAVRKTLLSTGRAMLVTTIVLSIGFFLYMFADMSNIVNFGLLTGFTIIMALLADFFLAPALMAVLHKQHLIDDDSDY